MSQPIVDFDQKHEGTEDGHSEPSDTEPLPGTLEEVIAQMVQDNPSAAAVELAIDTLKRKTHHYPVTGRTVFGIQLPPEQQGEDLDTLFRALIAAELEKRGQKMPPRKDVSAALQAFNAHTSTQPDSADASGGHDSSDKDTDSESAAVDEAAHDPFGPSSKQVAEYKATQSEPSHSVYMSSQQIKTAKEWAVAEWKDTFAKHKALINKTVHKFYATVADLAEDLAILYRPRAWTAFPWTSVNGAAPQPIVYDDVLRGYQGHVMYEGWAHKRHQIPGGPNTELSLSKLLFPTDASESRAELLKEVGLGDMTCNARANWA